MTAQLRDMIGRAGTGTGPVSKGEFWAGLAAVTAVGIATQAAARSSGRAAAAAPVLQPQPAPPDKNITVTVTPCSGHLAAAPTPAATAPDDRKLDDTKPWSHFVVGAVLVALVTLFAIWLYLNTPQANFWLTLTFWAFMVVPGLSLIGIGFYYSKQRKDGAIAYALTCKDYGALALQLLPGTLIAALGNLLPSENPTIPSSVLPVSWISFVLGTAVSILVVRKFEKP